MDRQSQLFRVLGVQERHRSRVGKIQIGGMPQPTRRAQLYGFYRRLPTGIELPQFSVEEVPAAEIDCDSTHCQIGTRLLNGVRE